ncbi:MAG: hypothetical protein ACLUD2_08840 [Clostridium sp.]
MWMSCLAEENLRAATKAILDAQNTIEKQTRKKAVCCSGLEALMTGRRSATLPEPDPDRIAAMNSCCG